MTDDLDSLDIPLTVSFTVTINFPGDGGPTNLIPEVRTESNPRALNLGIPVVIPHISGERTWPRAVDAGADTRSKRKI